MLLHCEICSKSFPTNTSLYIHKQTEHNKPTLLIMNHDHDKVSDNNEQLDDKLEIVDEYKFNRKRKRKDTSDSKKPKRPYIMPENDNNLEIVDEYNNENRDLDEDDDNLEIIDQVDNDSQFDNDLEIIDQVDNDSQNEKDSEDSDQNNQNLKIIDTYDRRNSKKNKWIIKYCMKIVLKEAIDLKVSLKQL